MLIKSRFTMQYLTGDCAFVDTRLVPPAPRKRSFNSPKLALSRNTIALSRCQNRKERSTPS